MPPLPGRCLGPPRGVSHLWRERLPVPQVQVQRNLSTPGTGGGKEGLLIAVLYPYRAINYDEKDPFLCNSCGFSKYAKFELMVEAKTCSAVDPIENEDDRKKVSPLTSLVTNNDTRTQTHTHQQTTTHISQLLEQADGKYKQLVQHRNELDNLLTSLASGLQILPSGRSVRLSLNIRLQCMA